MYVSDEYLTDQIYKAASVCHVRTETGDCSACVCRPSQALLTVTVQASHSLVTGWTAGLQSVDQSALRSGLCFLRNKIQEKNKKRKKKKKRKKRRRKSERITNYCKEKSTHKNQNNNNNNKWKQLISLRFQTLQACSIISLIPVE